MSTKLHSGQVVGLSGAIVDVEIDHAPGLFRFTIVGLPDKAVEESKERVSSAIKNAGFRPPQKKNNRITVNLAPADIPKEGAFFDLPIAIGYLIESGQTRINPSQRFFAGELALDGSLRPVRGALALAVAARNHGFTELFVPKENEKEVSLVNGITAFAAGSLGELVKHLSGEIMLTPVAHENASAASSQPFSHDFSDIKGQELAKRGIEIAAAGNHHVAFVGPPGTGKTLLARALPSILPPLSHDETLEVTAIQSVAGTLEGTYALARPFRSPHHTTSYVALVGGGTIPKPGEVTLAHRGVLFLDEFPEFDRKVIETLRQPLEDRTVSISRARGSITFPADIMLVAAMNPCPCGNRGSQKECVCAPKDLLRYSRKISGPIMDRIDIWLSMPNIEYRKLEDDAPGERSSAIRTRVARARSVQYKRFNKERARSNAEMSARELKKYAPLGSEERDLLENAARSLDLSARAYHRVIKVARTIADLARSREIQKEHLLEALQYRPPKELFA